MNKILVAAFVAAAAFAATPASAQVAGGASANVNVNPQVVDASQARRILCRVRPTRECANGSGAQRTPPGSRTQPSVPDRNQPGGARR